MKSYATQINYFDNLMNIESDYEGLCMSYLRFCFYLEDKEVVLKNGKQ